MLAKVRRHLTCNVKNRLETHAKPPHLHGIFNFDTVTQHSDTSPVFFGKRFVVVGVKCWALRVKLKYKKQKGTFRHYNIDKGI